MRELFPGVDWAPRTRKPGCTEYDRPGRRLQTRLEADRWRRGLGRQVPVPNIKQGRHVEKCVRGAKNAGEGKDLHGETGRKTESPGVGESTRNTGEPREMLERRVGELVKSMCHGMCGVKF